MGFKECIDNIPESSEIGTISEWDKPQINRGIVTTNPAIGPAIPVSYTHLRAHET